MTKRENWTQASDDEIPDRWLDLRQADYRCICSNGFEGTFNLGSVFLHRPSRWPQCFPGNSADSICTIEVLHRDSHGELHDKDK